MDAQKAKDKGWRTKKTRVFSFILYLASFILILMVDCYVGLGGNEEHSFALMQKVVARLKKHKGIEQLRVSRLYQTTPVSSVLQPPYLNAVCRFQCHMALETLWTLLCETEQILGKKPKPKDAPRPIDLDLLFYGSLVSVSKHLTLPHPRWHERLFVLAPLADVTETIPVCGTEVKKILKKFSNPHKETVFVLKKGL